MLLSVCLFCLLQYGRTEWLQDDLNPQFTTTIEMDYRFEEVQPLKFCVYDLDNKTSSLDDDDFLGALECTLGEVCQWVWLSRPFS